MSGTNAPTTQSRTIFLLATAFLWVLFKFGYPYADYFTDSYTYIQAAAAHDAISYRPIGYSLFLRLVHRVGRSDLLLVTVQFLLIQVSCWTLFEWLCRHCGPGPRLRIAIMLFLTLNPLVYYISNFVSSDALFIALSLFWLTSLLHLLQRPSWRVLILQWVLLLLIFYTRYVALFYPLVAAISFFRVRRSILFRLTAITGSVAIIAAAVFCTRALTLKETGTPVFSAFSGWQMANNALHIYPWLSPDTIGSPPATQALAGYVDRYFREKGDSIKTHPPGATTGFMWETSSPLHRYLDDYRRARSNLRQGSDTAPLSYFTAWHRVSPVYSQYGYFLMRRHPAAFSRYYLRTSAESFLLSPLDVLEAYNEGKNEIDPIARDWFGYPSTQPRVVSVTLQGKICAPFPWLSLLFTAAFASLTAYYLLRPGFRGRYPVFTDCLGVAVIYLGANACFNIFASPSVYRYQILPLILLYIFTACGLFFVPYGKQRSHV